MINVFVSSRRNFAALLIFCIERLTQSKQKRPERALIRFNQGSDIDPTGAFKTESGTSTSVLSIEKNSTL